MTGGASLAAQLRDVCVGLRSDLVVTRHVFRSEPCYVLRDPLTFDSQRFDAADYELLLRIRATRTLGQLFEELVEDQWLEQDDEEEFFAFVLDLHRKRLLKLPIADDQVLLGRHEQRLAAERRALWMAPVFWKRTLFNPDRFLTRTLPWVRPLFTRTAFVVWCVTVLAAGWIALAHAHELAAPLGQVLLTRNLALLWIALVGLKVVHELGHAYATRWFGGEVPEIGLNLIVLTPLPYVDASAAWSFPSKAQRLIVSLAGMYVELFVASIALFVWASTEASLLNAFAYLVAFTGSVVTLLFNLNPLMKFDGYYVLSDLLELPNLRTRSAALVRDWARRLFFGLPRQIEEEGRRLQTVLIGFGIAGAIYKFTLVLSLSAGIALKFPAVGLGLAAGYVGMELLKLLRGAWGTLGEVREREAGRLHGSLGALLAFVAVPLVGIAVPLPSWATAPATVEHEDEISVHAQVEGFLLPLGRVAGEPVRAGDVLIEIDEPEESARLAEGEARLEAAELQRGAALVQDGGALVQAEAAYAFAASDLAWRRQQAARRTPQSPIDGVLLEVPREDERGRFVRLGETVARIAGGRPVVRAVMRDDELVGARLEPGARVRFRSRSAAGVSLGGRISTVEPLAIEALEGYFGRAMSEEIAIDPATGKPLVPHFAVRVVLDPDPRAQRLPEGATGRLWIEGRPEPLLSRLLRPLTRFVDSLRAS